MQPHEMLRATLPGLSARMRAAFAGGCARRVFDILLSTGLIAPAVPRRALALLGGFAEGGELDEAEFGQIDAELGELVDRAREQYDVEVYYAMRTIYEAFMCAKRPDSETAAGVAYELVATASYALPSDPATAEAEEVEWIRAALDLARLSDDAAIRVAMFDGLGAMPPNWLLRWEER